jgi:protein SCO1/2
VAPSARPPTSPDPTSPDLTSPDLTPADLPREHHVTDEERRALLEAGPTKIPRRAVAWGLVAAVVLTLGGIAGEHLVSAVGLNPKSSPTTTTTLHLGGGLSPSSALLSFEPVPAVRVPDVTLTDQRGQRVALRSLTGKVVVVTFFNASCRDVCPVVAAEVRRANELLGRRRADVVWLTINTDPLRLGAFPPPPAVTATGLGALSNWHYLTGPLRTLNPIWKDFGVSISVYVRQRAVVHNDVLYVVTPRGRLVARGSPFSDEARNGTVTLPAPLERIAGDGLAAAVAKRLGHPR